MEGHEAVFAVNNVDALVSNMQKHIANAAVQKFAHTHLVRHLLGADAENAENISRAFNAGALDAVVAGMRIHADDVEVQTGASGLVYILIKGSAEYIARAESIGFVEVMMQVEVCERLSHILDHASTATKIRVGKTGAVEAVIEVIRGHIGNKNVCTAAIQLPIVVALNVTEHAGKAGTTGAVEVIVAAMRRHVKRGQLQLAACFVLNLLVLGDPQNGGRGL